LQCARAKQGEAYKSDGEELYCFFHFFSLCFL
jgi:hypothetical protein